MVDQGTSSAGKIVLLEDSYVEAGLGESSGRCNSADAGALGSVSPGYAAGRVVIETYLRQ